MRKDEKGRDTAMEFLETTRGRYAPGSGEVTLVQRKADLFIRAALLLKIFGPKKHNSQLRITKRRTLLSIGL